MQHYRILITCPRGIPLLLSREVSALGMPVLSEQLSGIETEGTLEDAMRLNLWLRTGHRVLLLFQEFRARDADDLYQKVVCMHWEEHIPEDGYLCVTSSVENPGIKDTRFATLKCKDAIVDRIRKTRGRRPDAGSDRSSTVVHLYWKDERCSIYFDTSGEPLSRRGYRKIPLAAPMQETLAAAVVLAAGWNGKGNFLNPMCGSGTLAIEAAWIGLNRAPGLLRSNFGFMHLKEYSSLLWDRLREGEKQQGRKSFDGRILATDVDPCAIEAARKNAITAGVEHLMEFSTCAFAETPVPPDGGVVVVNPPYGDRMGAGEQLELLYKEIGDYLKNKCRGYTGYVFTGNPALAKKVSLKPKRHWQFFNSGIECRLLEYDLYEGTRKVKKSKKKQEEL